MAIHILRSTLEKNNIFIFRVIINTALDSKIIREIQNYIANFIQIRVKQILRL